MAEVRIPIFINCRSGEKTVEAWARSADSQLACHPVYENAIEDGAWTITHRKTGKRINPSRVYSKEDALALCDVYESLADWTSINNSDETGRVRKAVEEAFIAFVPPSSLTINVGVDAP